MVIEAAWTGLTPVNPGYDDRDGVADLDRRQSTDRPLKSRSGFGTRLIVEELFGKFMGCPFLTSLTMG